MSETVPESAPRSSGSVFTRQIGPLPLWGWMGVGLAVALAYYYFKQSRASMAASQGSNSSAGGSVSPSGTDQSLIPQFVNQTYVNSAPPTATVPTSTGSTAPVAQASQYPAPTNEKLTKLTNTSAKINWDYITSVTPKPTSYTIAVYQMNGKLAQQFTINAPDTASGQAQATITGLHPGWQYNVNVWANGGKSAPPHSTAKLTLLWLGHTSKLR